MAVEMNPDQVVTAVVDHKQGSLTLPGGQTKIHDTSMLLLANEIVTSKDDPKSTQHALEPKVQQYINLEIKRFLSIEGMKFKTLWLMCRNTVYKNVAMYIASMGGTGNVLERLGIASNEDCMARIGLARAKHVLRVGVAILMGSANVLVCLVKNVPLLLATAGGSAILNLPLCVANALTYFVLITKYSRETYQSEFLEIIRAYSSSAVEIANVAKELFMDRGIDDQFVSSMDALARKSYENHMKSVSLDFNKFQHVFDDYLSNRTSAVQFTENFMAVPAHNSKFYTPVLRDVQTITLDLIALKTHNFKADATAHTGVLEQIQVFLKDPEAYLQRMSNPLLLYMWDAIKHQQATQQLGGGIFGSVTFRKSKPDPFAVQLIHTLSREQQTQLLPYIYILVSPFLVERLENHTFDFMKSVCGLVPPSYLADPNEAHVLPNNVHGEVLASLLDPTTVKSAAEEASKPTPTSGGWGLRKTTTPKETKDTRTRSATNLAKEEKVALSTMMYWLHGYARLIEPYIEQVRNLWNNTTPSDVVYSNMSCIYDTINILFAKGLAAKNYPQVVIKILDQMNAARARYEKELQFLSKQFAHDGLCKRDEKAVADEKKKGFWNRVLQKNGGGQARNRKRDSCLATRAACEMHGNKLFQMVQKDIDAVRERECPVCPNEDVPLWDIWLQRQQPRIKTAALRTRHRSRP